MLKRSKKTLAKNRIKKQLDDDARQKVFERDGHRCIRCNTRERIQWAHVFTRRRLAMRWEPDNAMTLCAGCHLWWHHHPAESGVWFFTYYPERYEKLIQMKLGSGKVDLMALSKARSEQ